MKKAGFRAWVEVNSRQAVFILGTVAIFVGSCLIYSYFQVFLDTPESSAGYAVVLAIFLPAFAALGFGALFFCLGSIQGILEDARAEQIELRLQLKELLEVIVDENRQRTKEVELLAEEIDNRS